MAILLVLSASGKDRIFAAGDPGSPVGPYQGFGYEWENNTLGLDRRVPPPWQPISIKGKTLEVWGRSHRFGAGLFPEQITSQGRDLLASPMRLRLRVNGQSLADANVETKITDQTHGDRVELSGTLQNADVRMLLRTSLEFDGFLRFDLTLTPADSAVSLQELIVVIPFYSQVSRFYSRFLNYDFNAQRVVRDDLFRSAGRISQPVYMPFTHSIWVGDHQVGAELSAETNQHWSNADPGRSIAIEPTESHTLLRLNLVDTPIKLSQEKTYSFAMYATPVRPMNPDWRSYIIGSPMQGRFQPPPGYDARLWTFCAPSVRSPGMVPLAYNGLPLPPSDPQKLAVYNQVAAKAKEHGVRFIPYSALMWLHSDIPEFQSYRKYWVRDLDQRERKVVRWQPSKRRGRAAGKGNASEISLYPKSIQDFLIWQYVRAADQWHQDGLFFDVATGYGNVVNPNAGELVPDPGKVYQPVFAVREFHKRLYKAVKARRPDFLITQHSAKLPILYGGFSDIVYSGESLNVLFREIGAQPKRLAGASGDRVPYVPDYSRVPDDFWKATYGSNLGFAQYLQPQVIKWRERWGDEVPKERVKARQKADADLYTRLLLSRALVLGLPVMRTRLDEDVFDRVMRGFQKFGGLVEPLTFIGPGEAERFLGKANQSRLLCSAYVRQDTRKMVLIIANWVPEKVSETLELNLSALPITKITKITDLEGGTPPPNNARSIQIDLAGNDFRVLMIE
jgi:hypothetical protein